MKPLYYVALHHHAKNMGTHFLVTANTEHAAKQIALNALNDSWRVKSVVYVCDTPDDVMMEV